MPTLQKTKPSSINGPLITGFEEAPESAVKLQIQKDYALAKQIADEMLSHARAHLLNNQELLQLSRKIQIKDNDPATSDENYLETFFPNSKSNIIELAYQLVRNIKPANEKDLKDSYVESFIKKAKESFNAKLPLGTAPQKDLLRPLALVDNTLPGHHQELLAAQNHLFNALFSEIEEAEKGLQHESLSKQTRKKAQTKGTPPPPYLTPLNSKHQLDASTDTSSIGSDNTRRVSTSSVSSNSDLDSDLDSDDDDSEIDFSNQLTLQKLDLATTHQNGQCEQSTIYGAATTQSNSAWVKLERDHPTLIGNEDDHQMEGLALFMQFSNLIHTQNTPKQALCLCNQPGEHWELATLLQVMACCVATGKTFKLGGQFNGKPCGLRVHVGEGRYLETVDAIKNHPHPLLKEYLTPPQAKALTQTCKTLVCETYGKLQEKASYLKNFGDLKKLAYFTTFMLSINLAPPQKHKNDALFTKTKAHPPNNPSPHMQFYKK